MKKLTSLQRLSLFYIVALSTIVLLSLSGQIIIQYALRQEILERDTANEVIRQRGCANEMIVDAGLIEQFPARSNEYRRDLQSLLRDWGQVQDSFYTQGHLIETLATLSSNALARIHENETSYSSLKTTFQHIVDNDIQISDANRILLTEGHIYQQNVSYVFDAANRQADEEVIQVQRIELLIFLAIVVTIIFEYVFVFRVSTRQLHRQLIALQENESTLATLTSILEHSFLLKPDQE